MQGRTGTISKPPARRHLPQVGARPDQFARERIHSVELGEDVAKKRQRPLGFAGRQAENYAGGEGDSDWDDADWD